MPKKRKNRGKQRNQKKTTTTNNSIQTTVINDGSNETESIEYINENEKLKNVIARLENKLQESVVETATDLPKCANTMNESSSVAKSSSSTVVQNTKVNNENEQNETAAPSSCNVDGNIVFPNPSSSLPSVNNNVKNYYKCNFCDFKLERIFENRKKLLEHLRTHKFPSIEHEIQKKRKANEEIALQSSNIEMENTKKHCESDENKIYAKQSELHALPQNSEPNLNSAHVNVANTLPNKKVKFNIKKKQSITIASIPSSIQSGSENNNVEESNIDAYYSSMDKRKNRSMPYIICKICNIKFTHKSSYIRHKISQHSNQKSALNPRTGEPFDAKQKICTQCNQVFSRESVLNQHISTVHYGLKPFECEYCKRKFSAKSNLFEHVRTHTRERPYNCEYCKTTFPYRSTLTTHIKNVHKNIIGNYKPPESNFRCKYCLADFPNYSQRYRHLKQVHQIATVNEVNEKIYDEDPLELQTIEIENSNVEIHSVYVYQTNDMIEVCDEQNELLKEEKEENEMTGMLMEVEEEYIDDSEHQYIDDSEHQYIDDSEHQYIDDSEHQYIDDNFDENTNEEQASEQVTTEETYYADNISDIIEEDYLEDVLEVLNDKQEYVEYDAEQQENSTSNLVTEPDSDIDVVNEINQTSSFSGEAVLDSKPLKSVEKTKEFKQLINTSKDNIDANVINKLSQDFIDLNDPKKCAKCGTSFSRVAVLHQHIKSVHLQLKPYKCGYCEKKFASRSNLIEHIRLHTGEKPYKCRACDEDFNRRGLFTKHVKIAHPERIKELLA